MQFGGQESWLSGSAYKEISFAETIIFPSASAQFSLFLPISCLHYYNILPIIIIIFQKFFFYIQYDSMGIHF